MERTTDQVMLNTQERSLVHEHAYVPEHLPDYVESISEAEPFLHEGCLCFLKGTQLIFVGYPIQAEGADIARIYESACERFHPATAAIIGPGIWLPDSRIEGQVQDNYYKLDLPLAKLRSGLPYMIRRAGREANIVRGTFGEDHRVLVEEFLAAREPETAYHEIFRKIPVYLTHSATARLLEARKGDRLVAFNVVDTGSSEYLFYLFNFRSMGAHVPGACDLLFYEMARLAEAEGKRAMNLGLGINPGVQRFKEKWGAVPLVPYASGLVRRKSSGLLTLLRRY